MEKINQGDQWKLDGKCSLCRRKGYCTKSCTAQSRRMERVLTAKMFEKMPFLTELRGDYFNQERF